MTGQESAAGEIALRLAGIAVSAGSARTRNTAMLRLLRECLGATLIGCYKRTAHAGKAPSLRTRASDARVAHPVLIGSARDAARNWLATGVAAPCVVDDPRFGGWQVAGCLPGGASAGLAVVALWPPDGNATAGAETLNALSPVLLLALGHGGRSYETHRLDATSGAKAGFVALVSHTMRTPLNTLIGFIEIVLDQPVGPLNERQREFLSYAHESGQALTQLVEDITLLSRADEGSLALRYERLDAAEIAARAVRKIETAAQAKGVRLNLHSERKTPPLEGDDERLAHALTKLLENAVKFSPEGGEVGLTVRAQDGAVAFAIRDQGPGIAPEDAGRIFMRFFQAERTSKSHPGGYGLGLAVAQVIAQAHAGEIRVASAPEHGATLILMVPISATKPISGPR